MKVYVHPSAKREFKKFDKEAQDEFISLLKRLEKRAELPRSAYKPLKGNQALFELRIIVSSGTYRGIGGKCVDGKAILLFFHKKTRKIPLRLVRIARKRLIDFA